MSRDLDLMEHADGEAEVELGRDGEAKVEALHELTELVRGRLERAADDVPEAKFASMWNEIDKQIGLAAPVPAVVVEKPGMLRRLARFLETYRSQIITGAVSAGAVAMLALVFRGGGESSSHGGKDPIDVRTVSHRPAEIEELDTPGGTGTVFNVDDEDGNTTVIWVTPEDTVEGI